MAKKSKKALAVLALVEQPTIERAAQEAGVDASTLHEWLTDPAFARQYRDARRRAYRQGLGLAVRYVPHAIQVLAQTMADPKMPSSSHVAAANGVLKFAAGLEMDDIAAKIDEADV